MSTINIRGVAVEFPFEPYELQREYMDKVIECLQNETNGVLESPTGTGKTLSLLCSTLGWLQLKKAQIQAQRINSIAEEKQGFMGNLLKELTGKVDNGTANNADNSGRAFMGLPTIIYASRTHTQLSQAMNELKRSAYKHMKACIIGSREQMCIHPEVMKEQSNSARTQMCRLKVKSRNCHFHNRVERKKEDPAVSESPVMDIEDLVKLGNLHKFCPYYMAREIQKEADIIFMPYNYLLDPKVRKSLGIVLSNNVVILDEAHNIERYIFIYFL
ncbi:unnamed protein product [Brassicogethes aeneus]|uniref:Helicase ATP-binding domain-containing protein n=1 Tax=Brassicogethes aeneus TaxID=1431903 RepID=A0A9P0AUB1_BRAAE|nr:unnamed protein product [Brassicogethes aeneus]